MQLNGKIGIGIVCLSLTARTYSVLFRATAPYKDITLSNINVQDGQETKLPAITLHQ